MNFEMFLEADLQAEAHLAEGALHRLLLVGSLMHHCPKGGKKLKNVAQSSKVFFTAAGIAADLEPDTQGSESFCRIRIPNISHRNISSRISPFTVD